MKENFSHTFEIKEGFGPFAPPPGATVEMRVTSDGAFWLSANRQGLLHLAGVLAELAHRKPGFHIHTNEQFQSDFDGRFGFNVSA